jgi:hypothetical protein
MLPLPGEFYKRTYSAEALAVNSLAPYVEPRRSSGWEDQALANTMVKDFLRSRGG